MRHFSLLIRAGCLAVGCFLSTQSVQAQSWGWARQTQSSRNGGAFSADASPVVDAQGNAYVAGTYGDSVRFGAQLLVTQPPTPFSRNAEATFVSKLSATGQWLWTATAAGTGTSGATGLAATPAGGVIVSGYFSDSVRFGSTTLATPPVPPFGFSPTGYFLAQLSAAGQWQWAVATPSADVRALATDAAGNIVLVGVLSDTATFGTTTLISRGQADTFVAKLTPAGQWLWAVQGGGLDEDGALGVAVRPAGTIYVTGGYTGTAQFGAITPPSTGLLDGYVAELSSAGSWQWVEPISTTALCLGVSVLVEPTTSDLLVGGIFTGQATFGATVLATDTVGDGFVARLSPSPRAWRWAAAMGSPGTEDYVSALAVDGGGATVYAAGQFGQVYGSGPATYPIATATFGPLAVRGFGGSDGCVGRLNGATGQWQNATAWGGTTDDYSGGLATLPTQGSVVVSGYFSSPSVTLGSTTLRSNPAAQYPVEVLIARLTLGPLGLGADADDAAAILTPNPAHHTTRLTLTPAPTARPLTLLDAVGRTVGTATLPANQSDLTLDLRGLPAGFYVVRCGGLTRRLVVE